MKKYLAVLLPCFQVLMAMDHSFLDLGPAENEKQLTVTVSHNGDKQVLHFDESFEKHTAATVAWRAREHKGLPILDTVETSNDNGTTWKTRDPESPIGSGCQVRVELGSHENMPTSERGEQLQNQLQIQREWRGWSVFFSELVEMYKNGIIVDCK